MPQIVKRNPSSFKNSIFCFEFMNPHVLHIKSWGDKQTNTYKNYLTFSIYRHLK